MPPADEEDEREATAQTYYKMASTKTKGFAGDESRSNGTKSYRPPFTIKLNDVGNKDALVENSSDQSAT